MDIHNLKNLQEKFNSESLEEIYDELPDSFINFTNSEIVNYCLHKIKVGTKSEQSARVLNSWINNEIIFVNEEDKGKIRRFDVLESIWLNLVIEARKFGIPLDSLKKARKDLMTSPIRNFSLFKFHVIESILGQSKILMLFEEGCTNILSVETYAKNLSIKRAGYTTHLYFKLQDYIALAYPNNAFEIDFNIQNLYENPEKMALLFFLKTNDFKSIKFYIDETDVRLLEDSKSLISNKTLISSISLWEFEKIEINIIDDVKVTITP